MARSQHVALRLIAISFFALAGDVVFESSRDLLLAERPEASAGAIALNLVALLVMVSVAVGQGRTGRAMRNEVVIAQSSETWLSNLLSVSLLTGLGLNAVAGLWWAHPVAALVVAALAAYSGWEAWTQAGRDGRAGEGADTQGGGTGAEHSLHDPPRPAHAIVSPVSEATARGYP